MKPDTAKPAEHLEARAIAGLNQIVRTGIACKFVNKGRHMPSTVGDRKQTLTCVDICTVHVQVALLPVAATAWHRGGLRL